MKYNEVCINIYIYIYIYIYTYVLWKKKEHDSSFSVTIDSYWN